MSREMQQLELSDATIYYREVAIKAKKRYGRD